MAATCGPTLDRLCVWLRATLGDRFPAPTNGIWRAGDGRPVARLGLALAGSERVAARATAARVDALLLHRPWGLGELEPGVGVLALHEALDARLTTGDNPWLAARLGFEIMEGHGDRYGQPLVVIARRPRPVAAGTLLDQLCEEFGGPLRVWLPPPPDRPVTTIALANAMRPALVAVAIEAGAALYITGTLRQNTCALISASDCAAVALGHHDSERWGLRWLAGELGRRFPVEVIALDGPL